MYNSALLPLGVKVLPHYEGDSVSSGHLYIMEIPGFDTEKRNQLIISLAERGITSNVHYKPLPLLSAYKNLGFNIDDYPRAYSHYEREVTLPLHTLLSDDDVKYITDTLLELLSK
jgi:dTDP-4-amino-4,6-dideoxygalactose transaminase